MCMTRLNGRSSNLENIKSKGLPELTKIIRYDNFVCSLVASNGKIFKFEVFSCCTLYFLPVSIPLIKKDFDPWLPDPKG